LKKQVAEHDSTTDKANEENMRLIRDRDEKVRKAEENLTIEKSKASSNVKEITDLKRQLADVSAITQKHSGELLGAKAKEEVL